MARKGRAALLFRLPANTFADFRDIALKEKSPNSGGGARTSLPESPCAKYTALHLCRLLGYLLAREEPEFGGGRLPPLAYFTESVYAVVLQKSPPPQISQLILYTITNMKNKLTDLCGNRLLHNDFINTFCDIKPPRDTYTAVTEGGGTPRIDTLSSC